METMDKKNARPPACEFKSAFAYAIYINVSVDIFTMIKYCFFFVFISVWSFSFYWHFWATLQPKWMIAFDGEGHVREFQNVFDMHGADLWIFHQTRRLRPGMHIGRRPFETFRKSEYLRMLLVHRVVQIPFDKHPTSVIEYKIGNETVASLWPRIQYWPMKKEHGTLDWYRSHGGHVRTVIL